MALVQPRGASVSAASPEPATPGGALERHQISRVRHELRRRTLTLASIERLTPTMLRLGFTCPDFADFASAGFDDHVKLFFPADPLGSEPDRPVMRDFTPRRFDVAAGTLVIDFALHEAGPATQWASAAKVGDPLAIGGPRGSMVIADDFDWYLLIGDESALPAIGRRLEELRPGVPVTSFVLLDGECGAVPIETSADWTSHWIGREGGKSEAETIVAALGDFRFPPGDGFVWIAGESAIARAARAFITEQRGHPKRWCKASGYWRRGDVATHEKIDE